MSDLDPTADGVHADPPQAHTKGRSLRLNCVDRVIRSGGSGISYSNMGQLVDAAKVLEAYVKGEASPPTGEGGIDG